MCIRDSSNHLCKIIGSLRNGISSYESHVVSKEIRLCDSLPGPQKNEQTNPSDDSGMICASDEQTIFPQTTYFTWLIPYIQVQEAGKKQPRIWPLFEQRSTPTKVFVKDIDMSAP
eukprot:TRINITY_DN11342_c0_g1_i7.p2 TRINITY_DN11342_c0_g1~~TRINITY_DN11342_c0_g1_i7.p2  ORF type:complete len:115 (-),score=3.45 TRINITY_DN11342_c0_g1_i7:625-969(-)